MRMFACKGASRKSTLAALIATAALFVVSAFSPVMAQTAATPPSGGTLTADILAWENFIRAVTPARGQQGKVVYETWASDQDIYVSKPCPPAGAPTPGCNVPAWPSPQAAKSLVSTTIGHQLAVAAAGTAVTPVVGGIGPKQGCGVPTRSLGGNGAAAGSGFPTGGATDCVGEEVRRDPSSFLYIVQNGLWSQAGLHQFFQSQAVQFPQGALNVKADWIPVATLAKWINQPEAFVTANFYTANGSLGAGRTSVPMAMTSMHVAIKHWGVPSNWIWANFENAYTPGRCDVTGCTDRFGAATQFVPPRPANWGQYGQCAKTPAVRARMQRAGVANVFNNYCLTGSQESYGTTSNPTLLGSPIIEPLNANVPMSRSSCISCHTAAAFYANGSPFTTLLVTNPIGPTALPPNVRAYDFMWGVINANAQ